MKRINKKYGDFRTGFIDLLLCCIALFIVLVFIQIPLINPVTKVVQEGIRKDAEYTIELKWAPNVDCDLDLWVADPLKTTVSFKTKNNGLMHLERDDLGYVGDTYSTKDKTYSFQHNTELVTIRGRVPGKYTINVHLYACRYDGRSFDVNQALPEQVGATITVTKLNPYLVVLTEREVIFDKVWEEKTAVTIEFDAKGYVQKYETDYVTLITVTKSEQRQ